MKPPFGLFTSSSFSLLPHAPLRSDLRQPRREIDYCNYDYDLASSEKIPPLYPVAVFSHLPTYVSASYPLPKTLAFRATEVICKVDRNTAPTYLAYYPKAAHWSFIDKTLNHPRVHAQALASSKPSDDDDAELLLRRLFFSLDSIPRATRSNVEGREEQELALHLRHLRRSIHHLYLYLDLYLQKYLPSTVHH